MALVQSNNFNGSSTAQVWTNGADTAMSYVDWKRNKAASFNWSTSEIDIGTSTTIKPASWVVITVSMVIKTSQSPAVYWILWNWGYQNWTAANSSWFIAVNSTWKITLTWNGTNIVSGNIVVNDWKWHTIDCVIRSTWAKVYVDWILDNSWNITLNAGYSSRSSWLWALHTDNVFYYQYLIDEFSIDNTELTASYIKNKHLYINWFM